MNRILFGGKKQILYELTPYYYRTFEIGREKYSTLMHYWYTSYFKDENLREMIRNTDTVEHVIWKGKKLGIESVKQIDSKYVLNGIEARFNQNRDLRDVLLSTGNAELMYRGEQYLTEGNKYGKVLMRLREIYDNE